MKLKKKVNMNVIVGRRQIVLGTLVMGLCVAVYLNWHYGDITNAITTEAPAPTVAEEVKNYGDAKYVDTTQVEEPVISEGEAYFAEAKMTRNQSRDEATAALAEMLADASLATNQRAELAVQATELAQSIEVEGKIENLLKAKGFEDCMVYYDTERVDVIVKTEGLLEDETVQIWDIITKETTVPSSNVSIIEINN